MRHASTVILVSAGIALICAGVGGPGFSRRMPRFRQLLPQKNCGIALERSNSFPLLEAWRVLWDHVGLDQQEGPLAPYLMQARDVATRGELKLRALSFFGGGAEEESVGPILSRLDSEAHRKVTKLIEAHPQMPLERQELLQRRAAEVMTRAREALQETSEGLGERRAWLPSWTSKIQVLEAALVQITTPEMAETGMHQGKGQEADVGHWLEELTGGSDGGYPGFSKGPTGALKLFRNLHVVGQKKEVPQGIKAEVDGLIVEQGPETEPPVLRAIVECKSGLAIYGDLRKMDLLLEFLEEESESGLAHFCDAKSELLVKLAKDVEVKYFMGFLPEGHGGELERLLRPSVLRQEKGRMLQGAFAANVAGACAMELVEQPDEVSPWAMEVTLPEHQVTLAQERVNAFLQDVEERMEQGRLSIYIREEQNETSAACQGKQGEKHGCWTDMYRSF